MKKFSVLFLVLFVSFVGYGQVTLDLDDMDITKYFKNRVEDEAHAAVTTPQNAATVWFLKKIKEGHEKEVLLRKLIEKTKKTSKFLKTIKSAKKLEALLDHTICMRHQISLYAQFYNRSDCITNLNFQKTLFDYDATLDWIYMIFSAGITMSQADRIKTLDDAIHLLEKYNSDCENMITSTERLFNDELFDINSHSENYLGLTRRVHK